MIFRIGKVIEHFSRWMPFEAGDLVAMGAPAGVAVGQPNANELYLKPGDLIEIAFDPDHWSTATDPDATRIAINQVIGLRHLSYISRVAYECAVATPNDLNADAQQDEGGKPYEHIGAAGAKRRNDSIGKPISVGRKGVAIIRDMSRDEVEQLYILRMRLEGVAALLTARNITSDEIAELKRINEQFAAAVAARDLVAMLEVRARFHALLVSATRNRWLGDILIMLRDYAYPVRHVHWQDAERAARTIDLHYEMICCLEEGDRKQFRQLVIRQIREGLEVFRNRLIPLPA